METKGLSKHLAGNLTFLVFIKMKLECRRHIKYLIAVTVKQGGMRTSVMFIQVMHTFLTFATFLAFITPFLVGFFSEVHIW